MKIKPLIVLLSTFIIGFAAYYFLASFHPSDQSMKTFFLENKDDFEKLRMMFYEDKTCSFIRSSKESQNYDCQLSDSRHGEYQELLKKLKVFYSVRREWGDQNSLSFSTSFIIVDDSDMYERFYTEKGYIYTTKTITSLKELLDNSDSYGYKKLEGNWYIYYKMDASKPE